MNGMVTVSVELSTCMTKKGPFFSGGYIRLRKGKVAKTVMVNDDINVDLDEKRRVLGIEFLEVPFPRRSLQKIVKDYGIAALKRPKEIAGLTPVMVD